MTPQTLIGLALQMPGAYEDHPFGPESVIIKVEGRIFAQIFTLRGVDSATLNCDRMTGDFYRQMFPGVVVRGYHCRRCSSRISTRFRSALCRTGRSAKCSATAMKRWWGSCRNTSGSG